MSVSNKSCASLLYDLVTVILTLHYAYYFVGKFQDVWVQYLDRLKASISHGDRYNHYQS